MSDLTDLIYTINQRRNNITMYESYFDGTAKVTFVGEELQLEFGEKLEHMYVNRCAPIIETTLDKLKITGFESPDGDDVDQIANDVWKTLRLGRVARSVHFDALVAGDGWVLVWPEEDGIKVVPQEPSEIAVLWSDDDPNVIEVAAKTWQLRDGRWRLNLFYQDRVEKYITKKKFETPLDSEAAWERHSDKGDISWPVYHTMGRVPLFHFSVKHRAGTYGHSDLADIIPLQDRLNMTIANQAVAEEFQSAPQRWASGIQVQRDPETGDPIHPFQEGAADRIFITGGNDARFGQFDAADLTQFETVMEGHEVRIARTARIPMFYLVQSGTPPSGEALKTAEAPFIAKVKARMEAFGDEWAACVSFVLGLMGVPDAQLETMWESPHTRDETAEIERAMIKQQLGVSRQQTLRELGYDEEAIEMFTEEREVDETDIGDALVRSFNAM